MIIISKFRDYYDTVAAHGVSTDLRYIRTTKIVDKYPTNHYKYSDNTSIIIIGFCGKIYFCHTLNKFDDELSTEYFYTIDDIINRLIISKKYKPHRWIRKSIEQQRKDDIKEWEKKFSKNEIEIAPKYKHLFLKYSVPIFKEEIIKESNIYYKILELNPRLNLYEFYRVFDSYTAYQEIAMFLGGIASPEKPIPKIPDKIMVEAKGFNKYSFRKDKQK